ncbi:U6 snRNA phosphodiesterase [Nymphon striatum]|nr:U6 snRNA phosphodiesterase [Nymphon striatum]
MQNSLGFLAQSYDSSSEEENDSRFLTENKDDVLNNSYIKTKKSQLPVPDKIKSMFENAEENIEDASKHDGRIRSFPHVRGNWATYIFIPCKTKLNTFISLLNSDLNSDITKESEFLAIDSYHISLSQTVQLQHHWIEPLIEIFNITLRNLDVYTNEEKTRTFVGMKVDVGFSQILQIVNAINQEYKDFKLPLFYKNPSFHISFAWSLGDCKALLPKLPKFQEELEKLQIASAFTVTELQCKSGNRLFSFPLNANMF